MDLFNILWLYKIYKKDEEVDFNFASDDNEIDITFLSFINNQVKKFRNKYVLKKGDEFFNNRTLQDCLNTLWWTGRVALTEIDQTLNVFTFINEMSNYKNEIINAIGYHANFLYRPMEWKNIKSMLEFKLNKKNSVFMFYNSLLFSGFVETIEWASRYKRAWLVYDKNLVLAQKMLIFRDGHNIGNEQAIVRGIKKFKLAFSRRKKQNNIFDKDNLIGNNNQIDTLEFNTNLVDIKNAIDNIKSEFDELYGNKTNINFKKERQLSSEMDLLNYHFDVINRDTRNNIELMIDRINKKWNKQYQLISVNETNDQYENKKEINNEQTL